MSRRMSVSMTLDAVRERRKTVTRRHHTTWKNLRPGDRLTLIEKGMGLPKGAKQTVVCDVEITDVREEPLSAVTGVEVTNEGFPYMTVPEFIAFWLHGHGYPADADPSQVPVTRIAWVYLDDDEEQVAS